MKSAAARKPGQQRLLSALALTGAAAFVLTAAKCENRTTFPEFLPEMCTDKLDNDEDGKVDCKDTDCADECRVTVTINEFAKPVKVDTLEVSGNQTNAASVVVNLTAPGVGGTATVEAGTWKRSLVITTDTTYTLTVIATNGDIKDTATTTFDRKH